MKLFKKISGIFCSCLLGLSVLVLLALAVVRLAGYETVTTRTAAMAPEIGAGTFLVTEHTDPHSLQPGDVVCYIHSDDTVVTSRVMSVVPDKQDPSVLRFRTRGDANTADDRYLVHENNVIGKPVLQIPVLGHVVNFVSTAPGIYIAIGAAILLLVLLYLPDILDKLESRKKAGRMATQE